MKKTLWTTLAMVMGMLSAHAQVVCNDDGTVTFQYKNEQAKDVQVDVQFAGKHAMKRDAQTGLWTVTLGPAAPDMYPYHFEVDGISVMDPLCEQYFPNEGFKNSLLEIPSKQGPLAHDIRKVPHGQMEYVHYFSKSLGATNSAVVYLPPNYRTSPEKKYPVFYLISGTTDTEEVYYKVGRVNYILDNLLAEKAAKEMIVVLPYGNPNKLLPAPPAQGMPMANFGGDVFSKDLINDLMPYIERNYRTINDRDHRAIGGFSRGGNQGLSNGLRNLDKFSYLCSYSSFTSTDIPEVYDHAAETNKKLHLFWLGVGTDDFLYGTARDYMEFLDKKGIRSVKEYTDDKFGHTWMNAKYFLDKTLRLLFNPKASADAMKHAAPVKPATGKEQQFTPGVMARLFPRPIVSPEYTQEGVWFRFKAPNAERVALETELRKHPLPMQKDSDGVWSVRLTENMFETFKYCFVVDGIRVADPSNMYLSPDKGFKYSIADNPMGPFNYASMEDIPHGKIGYDLEQQEAWYMSEMKEGMMPRFIQLVPSKDDTMESWFKTGSAGAIADRLIADGKAAPCIITTSKLEFMKQWPQESRPKVMTLRADDYGTWAERRRALFRLLQGKEHAEKPKMRVVEDGGTGPFKAIMTEVKGLDAHTVIAPQDLTPFSAEKPLPVLVWGNGACANSPFEHVKFLSEIASYGYLVVATGYIPMTDEWYRGPMSKSEQQIESIDWVYEQNSNPSSPYYQKIDVKNLCIAGMSCGGLQSLFNCADPRVSAVMICNSGLFNQQNANQAVGGMPMPPKEKLKELHTPIIYILGGEKDIAYGNGMDDFHRIEHVPAIATNYPVGHGGTYAQPHGGEFAIVAKAWLDWQLKGDQEAAKMFVGKDCGLTKREGWTIEKNGKVK